MPTLYPLLTKRPIWAELHAILDVVTICEAAGFDVVMIETVGVGQSETIAANLSDLLFSCHARRRG